MSALPKCLLLEDSQADSILITRKLREVATVQLARDRASFERLLTESAFDVILLDFSLPSFTGNEAIELADKLHPKAPIILVTGSISHAAARAACRANVTDFIIKGVEYERLDVAVKNAYEKVLKEQENEKLRLQQMRDQRLEVLGNLSAGVAHDANNIFQVMTFGIDQLRKCVNAEGERVLDAMDRSTKRGAELMAQILAFARGTNGSVMKPVAIEFILTELGQMLRSGAFPNIRSTIKISPGTSKILCDQTQVQQVLSNLIINARDVLPNGGQIDITAQNILLHDHGVNALNGEFVMVSVRDNGPGVPDYILPKIFDAFVSSKPPGAGTGMGLAICKGIMEGHGGALDVKTGPAGTTFFCYFNVASNGHANEHTTEPEFDGAGRLIVIAEDDDTLRYYMQTFCETANYRVLPACNGAEALAHFRDHSDIAGLLTDKIMPAMGGMEVIQALRGQGVEFQAVLMTGYDATGPIDPGIPVLQKPFSREALLTKLKTVLTPDTSSPQSAP